MSRLSTRSLILGLCALSFASVSLADLPAPAPQRAHNGKASPTAVSPPHAVSVTPLAHAGASPATQSANSHGIIFVGGKSAINSQPVPPGHGALNTQPIPPGRSALNTQPIPPGRGALNTQPIPPGKLKPVGPGPGDPALHQLQHSAPSP